LGKRSQKNYEADWVSHSRCSAPPIGVTFFPLPTVCSFLFVWLSSLKRSSLSKSVKFSINTKLLASLVFRSPRLQVKKNQRRLLNSVAKRPKKAGRNIVKGDKKKSGELYMIYFFKHLKQFHLDILSSLKAMESYTIGESFVKDIFQHIAGGLSL